MLELSIIAVAFVAISVFLLCIKLILVPGSKFGGIHISESKELRKRGIHCVQSMDAMARRENKHRVKERR